MITEYHRPQTLDEALTLLSRPGLTLPMGGGTLLSAPRKTEFAVADLQALPLKDAGSQGKFYTAGAGVTLAALSEHPDIGDALRRVIFKEATQNLLNQATVGGALVAADGRSPLGCALLALGAQVAVLPGPEEEEYGQFLHLRSITPDGLPYIPGRLVTEVRINTGAELAYEYVARSPADRPIVIVAHAAWPSGRRRVVVGGWGLHPRLAFDGAGPDGVVEAVSSAMAESGDQWASAAYRQEAAVRLAERVLAGGEVQIR